MKGMTRLEAGKLIQFVTGHGWLKRHLRITGEGTDDLCTLCGENPEEPGHLFWHCSVLKPVTSNLSQDYWTSGDKAYRVLHFIKEPAFENLDGFRASQNPPEDT